VKPDARLLSELSVTFPLGLGGNRKLTGDLLIDLGYLDPRLHRWDQHRPEGAPGGVYVSDRTTTVLRVPAGTIYDGASIPYVAQYIAGPKELYERASAGHDFLYQEQAPRGASDLAFWAVARSGQKQVTEKRGWLAWAGVRLGGWWAYWKNGRRKAKRNGA